MDPYQTPPFVPRIKSVIGSGVAVLREAIKNDPDPAVVKRAGKARLDLVRQTLR